MRKIALTHGRYALVDDEDFDYLNQWKWCVVQNAYAVRQARIDGRYISIRMHRLINKTPKGKDTDHINGNGFDNRKSNLRTATRSQNARNSRPRKSRSGHKGVAWDSANKKWRVQVALGYKTYTFGRYDDLKEAIKVADTKRLELHGEYARII